LPPAVVSGMRLKSRAQKHYTSYNFAIGDGREGATDCDQGCLKTCDVGRCICVVMTAVVIIPNAYIYKVNDLSSLLSNETHVVYTDQ
jgi:hypothetical protein